MRVDISKSSVRSKYGQIFAIEAKNRAFHFDMGKTPQWRENFSAESMHSARVQHGIDPVALQKAVQLEGYVIEGLEIARFAPMGCDDNGIVTEALLREVDLELVRDWQVRDSEDELWTEWDRESKCWSHWRPASWAEAEEQEIKAEKRVGPEVEDSWPTPFSEEERAAVLSQVQSGALPSEISGLDLHLWTVAEALGLNYDQAQRALARRDPKTCALRVLAKNLRESQGCAMSVDAEISESGNLRPPWLESEPQQDLVYERLAQIANVPYDEAVTMASFPAWQKTVKKLIQDQASADALKKYGIEIDWPASKYHEHARALADLVVEKQRQYGDSAGRSGKILAVLYPDGIPVEKYGSALLVVRVLDKLSRIATHEVDAGGEEPWKDIAGYALLALAGKL